MNTELGFIYYLQNPITGEIFYVGSTTSSLNNRLRTHYQHLREFERGLRKSNKRYEYLLILRPEKATIHLLEIVTSSSLEEREVYYIQFFRKLNPNLTNMTDGGKGKHTSKYYTEKQLEEQSAKISKSNKGRKKPKGFAENLSESRRGLNNPAVKGLSNWIVCFKYEQPIRLFKYGFEVNNFINSKHAYGNVYSVLKDKKNYNPYGYHWQYYNECEKNIQDIVQSNYESN